MAPVAIITFERGRGQPQASQADWPGEVLGVEVVLDPARSPRFVEAAKANQQLFPAFERRGKAMVRFFAADALSSVLDLIRDVFGASAMVRGPDGQLFEADSWPLEDEEDADAPGEPLRATDEALDVLPRSENNRRVGDQISDGETTTTVTWIDPTRDSVRVDDGTFISVRPTTVRQPRAADAPPSARALRTEQVLAAVAQMPVLPVDERGPVSAVGLPRQILSNRQLPEGLSDYQQEGARWMDARGRAILADEMGLGKTVQAAVIIDAPAVIACPKTLKTNWRRELARWRPDLSVYIVEGSTPPPVRSRSADVIIINYDILTSHVDWIIERGNQTLLADEAHMLKNLALRPSRENRDILEATGGSNRARLFFEMAMRTPRLYFLTGTPFENRPSELFPMLHMVEPRVFMDQIRFRARYESGFRNADLFQRINYTFMLRRRKDVLPDFPEKVRCTQVVSLSDEVRPTYQQAANDFLTWVARTGGADAAMRAQRAQALTRLNALRKWAAVGKVEAAMEFITEFFESTRRPLVVMAHHTEVFGALDRALRELNDAVRTGRGGDRSLPSRPLKYAIVSGKTPGAARDLAKDAFQDGQIDIIIWAIDLATGVTLTRASDMLFMERTWVPAKLVQAEDRCVLEGQLVMTESGWRPIETVEVGDRVWTHEGQLRTVVDAWHRGHRDLITEVTYGRFNTPLRVTHDHRVLACRDGVVRWAEAHTLLPSRDQLVIPTFENDGRGVPSLTFPAHLRHDASQYNQFGAKQENGRYVKLPDSIEVDDDLLVLFGWYVAEGFCSSLAGKGSFVSLAAHERERPILERCAATISRVFGVSSSIYTASTHGIELRAFSRELALWFEHLFATGSRNKRIPAELRDVMSPVQVRVLLDSYFGGDGYRRPHETWKCAREATTVSSRLASDVLVMLIRLGVAPKLRRVDNVHNDCWIVGWPHAKKLHHERVGGFVLHEIERVVTLRASSAKVDGKYPHVYDLTVDGSESFIVGQAVVHNCHRRGQTNLCTITYLDAEGTIDRYMAMLLASKTRTFAGVIDGRNLTEAEAFSEVVGMLLGQELRRNPGGDDGIVEVDGQLRAAWGSWDQPI